jgi:hypothetical protein
MLEVGLRDAIWVPLYRRAILLYEFRTRQHPAEAASVAIDIAFPVSIDRIFHGSIVITSALNCIYSYVRQPSKFRGHEGQCPGRLSMVLCG